MKKRILYITLLLIGSLILVIRCKQTYDPPAIKNPGLYLVVDGFINTAANSVTTINLNRTRGLGDSTANGIPEGKAKVVVQSSNGASWPLTDPTGAGVYTSAPLTLDITQKYSIRITTSDGRIYASDAVVAKQTPPIDSVYWRKPGDLSIYADTHDPTGNSRYYRFDYLETYEHDAANPSPWGVADGMIYVVDTMHSGVRCYTTRLSSTVLLANSTTLSQDVISSFAVNTIPYADARLNVRYSVLVRDYALAEDAYNYWQIVQKTSDNTGTLFDLQPSQLIGNIHCTSNPSEPVIGFLSATSAQQQRIFIGHLDVNWPITDTTYGCNATTLAVDPLNSLVYNYPDTSVGPWYFITSSSEWVLLPKKCMNCLYQGGTIQRPSFWQ